MARENERTFAHTQRMRYLRLIASTDHPSCGITKVVRHIVCLSAVFSSILALGPGCGGAPAKIPPPAQTVTVTTPTDASREDATAVSGTPAAKNGARDEEEPPRGEPKEQVRLGALTITGPRSIELVQERLRGEMLHVRSCHERALAAGRSPKGWLRIRLVVSKRGVVTTAARVAASSLSDQALTKCVLAIFNRAQFPAAVGPDSEIVYPIYFTP